MNLLNKIIIKFSSSKVGADEFGNSYFEEKSPSRAKKRRRFVIYSGKVEASKVPSRWHRWLHYTSNEVPVNINTHKNSWQKIHLPNLTGTLYSHSPKNAADDLNNRKKVSSDYESWSPKN